MSENDFKLCLCLNETEISQKWIKTLKSEKIDILLFRNFAEFENFVLISAPHPEKTLLIIQIHPQICLYETLLEYLAKKDISVIVCGENLNNSMVAEILLKGAEDYVNLNIDPLILRAKIISHFKRMSGYKNQIIPFPRNKNIISSEKRELKIRIDKMSVLIRGKKEVILTQKELSILGLLISNENRIVRRTDVLKNIWKDKVENINPQILDKYIEILRKKLNSVGQNIKTIYGLGYMYKGKE